MPFEEVEGDHVLSIDVGVKLSGQHPDKMYMTSELSKTIADYLTKNLTGRSEWTGDGIGSKLLKVGGSGWVQGKARIKISIEFCPDEPANTSELEEFRQ